jgi:uncharacterized protein YndB with AHSA1/START domain
MIAFKHSALINAPVEKVFTVVSDPRKIPEWRKDVPGVSEVNGETKVGMTFTEEVHLMGTKRLEMKVTELIPNQKLVIEAQGGMPMLPTQTFTFTPDGSGTRLTISVVMKTSGFFTMMEFMLPAQLKKLWEKYFISLDQLLAGRGPGD